ncbi:hypothetical protein F5Y18DRAFT_165049 [Xylariaceae sp. FL1019]|nr:hypothetical protein F5Y18DRAFT_165049 [Xylariaceae sp. FL1019]
MLLHVSPSHTKTTIPHETPEDLHFEPPAKRLRPEVDLYSPEVNTSSDEYGSEYSDYGAFYPKGARPKVLDMDVVVGNTLHYDGTVDPDPVSERFGKYPKTKFRDLQEIRKQGQSKVKVEDEVGEEDSLFVSVSGSGSESATSTATSGFEEEDQDAEGEPDEDIPIQGIAMATTLHPMPASVDDRIAGVAPDVSPVLVSRDDAFSSTYPVSYHVPLPLPIRAVASDSDSSDASGSSGSSKGANSVPSDRPYRSSETYRDHTGHESTPSSSSSESEGERSPSVVSFIVPSEPSPTLRSSHGEGDLSAQMQTVAKALHFMTKAQRHGINLESAAAIAEVEEKTWKKIRKTMAKKVEEYVDITLDAVLDLSVREFCVVAKRAEELMDELESVGVNI